MKTGQDDRIIHDLTGFCHLFLEGLRERGNIYSHVLLSSPKRETKHLKNFKQNNYMKYISLLFIAVFILSCQGEKKCEFKPEPILKKEWKGLSNYTFQAEGKKSTETVTLPNSVRMELFQEVCDYSQQEFHFFLKGTEEMKSLPDAFWIAEAMKQFYYLSSINPEIRSIASYGDFIKQDVHQLQLGEKFETQDGYSIFIDRIIGTEEMKIIVKFS